MNDSASQLLNQLNSGSQSINSSALNGLQTYLVWFFWLGLISTVIITVAFVVYFVHKMRVQSAIMRIDKNLQRFVDHQIGPTKTSSLQPAEATNTVDVPPESVDK